MSSCIDTLLTLPPYGVDAATRTAALSAAVNESLQHHYDHCQPYRRWCDKRNYRPEQAPQDMASVPFLPVGIFKRLELSSVNNDQVVRVLTSSATSSQIPSRIVLDQVTRNRQMRALTAMMTHLLGGQRRPFIVLDEPPTSGSSAGNELSARAAGMRGYLMAASAKHYVLRDSGAMPSLDVQHLRSLAAELKASAQPFCFLGYTYLLYQAVIRPLFEQGICLDLPENVFVLHFGGWKKLQDQAVDRSTLNAQASAVFGIPPHNVRDIYGFTEQLGVIYSDDGSGFREVPTYSEVLVRDPATMQLARDGEVGLLEFICPLPHSYPGVAILLDDLGRIVVRESDDGQGVRRGFEVLGRAARAEPRGCGDTLPSQVYAAGVSGRSTVTEGHG